jgi:hypothetical protein
MILSREIVVGTQRPVENFYPNFIPNVVVEREALVRREAN